MKQREKGMTRTLVGFEMTARQIARDGCDITVTGENVGRVTSGSPAPFLKKNIGMAYVQPVLSEVGTEIEIGIRGNRAAAKIVPLPFYKRPK